MYTRDKIVGFSGSWMSGLGALVLEHGSVHCENAPTVRALDDCFGGVIGEGHTALSDNIRGKDIVYSMDDMGLVLAGFTPYDKWLEKGLPEIEIGETIEIEPEGEIANE